MNNVVSMGTFMINNYLNTIKDIGETNPDFIKNVLKDKKLLRQIQKSCKMVNKC